MHKLEESMFPDGLPAYLTVAAFSRLMGVSVYSGHKMVRKYPDMLVTLPGEKNRRVKSELYVELTGRKNESTH